MLLRPVSVDDLRVVVGDGMVSLSGSSGPVLDVVGDLGEIAQMLERFTASIYDAHAAGIRAERRYRHHPWPPPSRRAVERVPRLVSAGDLRSGMRVLPDLSATARPAPSGERWVTVLSVVKCGRSVEVATDAPSRSVRLWDTNLSVWVLPAVDDERGAA